MAFTYHDNLDDARSRVRYAVGDIVAPGLFQDATYDSQIALQARQRATFTATAEDDTFTAVAHGYTDGAAAVVVAIYEEIGLAAQAIAYVRDTTDDTFTLASAPGGDAIDLTADGAGQIGLVDEAAACREIAAGLAARYATKPTNVRLTSGLAVSWPDRVAQWLRIARGEAGGASSSRGKGFRLKRGPAVDYTTGEGDA